MPPPWQSQRPPGRRPRQKPQAQAANQPNRRRAEGDLIIVTATKRASTVQDVPFSINAQTQEDIQRANANTIEDISRNVAGLAVQNLGPGQSQVSIRGVSAGQIVRDQPGVKEQVGVYLDESVISLSLFTPDFDLFDLNRVETLRGPQGTLFGSGSVGGTLRYITNQPRLGETEGLVEANVNTCRTKAISAVTSRARSMCRSAILPPFARSAMTPNMPASSTRSARPAARTSTTAAASAAASRCCGSRPTTSEDHAARGLPEDQRRRLQPRGILQPLRQPVHHRRRIDVVRQARRNICSCARSSRTIPCLPI